jgi:pimeloyl-ACP methyl ester carboxylesterase
MGDVVLVHGAWVGPDVWEFVTAALRERGHRVEAVALHRGTLAADTAAAQDVVDRFGAAVVVCGWSYGGMVITGLALRPGSHLVYVCAFMPDEHDTALSLNDRYPAGVAALVSVDEAGDLVVGGDEIDDLVWADAPPDRARAARASLQGQAVAAMIEPPARVAWRDTASTYVVGTQDRLVHPALQREMARQAGDVVEWDTSHAPMLSRPDLVVDLLDRLAAR